MFKLFKVLYFLVLFSTKCNARLIVQLDRLEFCKSSANSGLTVNSLTYFNPRKDNFRANADIVITRNYSTPPQLVINVTRCLSKESLDTCLPLTTLKPLSTCGLLKMDNTAWGPLFNAFHPRLGCPFPIGNVKLINGTFAPELFSFFPIANLYWRVELSFVESHEFVTFCADANIKRYYF